MKWFIMRWFKMRRNIAGSQPVFGNLILSGSLFILGSMLIVLIGLSSPLESATITFPSQECSTIQDAINNAQEGDTILISPGRYQENLVIDGKSINLEGDNTTEAAAILNGGNKGPCLILKNGSNGKIQGLTIQNGNAHGNGDEGGGIACYQSDPAIINNIFKNNAADKGMGGGIFCHESSPTIENNKFYGNRAEKGEGAGIFTFRSTPVISHNEFVGNLAENGEGGGITLMESAGEISENSFVNNLSNQGEDIYVQHSHGNMVNNMHEVDKDPAAAVVLNQSAF